MRYVKRMMITLLLFAIAVTSGCGKQKESMGENQTEGTEEDYVYTAEYLPLSQDGSYISNPVFGDEQNVLYLKSDSQKVKLISMKLGTDTEEEIPLALEENAYATALGKDMEGNLLVGVTRYQEKENAQAMVLDQVIIRKLSQDGRELLALDLGNTFLTVPDFYISDLVQDKEGNFYICTGQDFYVLKPDGSLYFQIKGGYYIDSMFALKDGRIVVSYYGDRGYELKEISTKDRNLKDLTASVKFDYGVYQSGVDTDLLYTQESVLYSCNLTDEKPVKILKWIDYDVNSHDLETFTILPDGRIAALTCDMIGNGGWELILLTKAKRSEVPEKTILTYGAQYISYFAERDIQAFNRQSDKYRVEVKEYGDATMEFSDKADLFAADLTGGNAPDIIDLTYCPLPLETLISSGAVEDLNPYLDADTVIKREDYVESAMRAYERDGKLYAIMPYFGVDVLVGKVENIGEGSSWTIDDMMKLFSEKGKGASLLPGATKSGILEIMCTMNRDIFIDEVNGKCDFTGEEFKKILEFSNQFPMETDYDPNDSVLEELRSGEILLYRDIITSIQQYQMYEFMFGGPVNLIGYPTFGESGLTFTANSTTVGMSSSSANKEGVWEFIRFHITKSRQENVGSPNGGFPILKSALEKQLEKDSTAEYESAPDGTKKEKVKATWGTMDFSVDVYAATDKQVEAMREMIENAQADCRMESEIFAIINEEAQGYFSGHKSVEDAASVVQNRVQLYLNETDK